MPYFHAQPHDLKQLQHPSNPQKGKPMELAVVQRKSVVIITIKHESLDARNVKEFRGDMKPLLDGFNTVILNLSQVTIMDPSVISALLACHRLMEERGGQFCLCAPTTSVHMLIKFFDPHSSLTIYGTVAEALRELTEQGEAR